MIVSQSKKDVRFLNKRENIIDAATEVFIEKGTDKTTIADIVKKAGIAQGTFYLYFPTKLAVMPAIAEQLVEKLCVRFEMEVTSSLIEDQLLQVIDIIFDHTNQYKELTKLVYTGLTQTPYLGHWEKIYDPLYHWIESLLLQAKKNGKIRTNLHVTYAAKVMIGMIESAAEQIYLFDSSEEKQITKHRDELYDMVFNALTASK